ncbi:MAG: NAD+ synthase [Candidatus Omnitrophica bacterium]|nr:NAD+ synthase [Candidatus Omnitrophota bacterium]
MKNVRIAIGQINTTVGDLKGNKKKILSCAEEAVRKNADLIAFPELSITGYPPEDLLLKPYFIKENIKCLKEISEEIRGIIAVLGFVDEKNGSIYNSAAVIHNKKIVYVYHKMHLPNYGVFDEKRYFKPGTDNKLIKIKDMRFRVNICEDIWVKGEPRTTNFARVRGRESRVKGAQFLINISASPYHIDKIKDREKIIGDKAKKLGIPVVYCNLVGGQDELVFDGRSALFGKYGKIIAEARAFEEDLLIFDLVSEKISQKMEPLRAKARGSLGGILSGHCLSEALRPRFSPRFARDLAGRECIKPIPRDEEIYSALVLGVKDYLRKNNFTKAALGLSGGIDSALVACIAKDALGRGNVLGLSMPSRYSSRETQKDSEIIAKNLGIKFKKAPIDNIFASYLDALGPHFKGLEPDIAEENIQARIRGNMLMAFSNKFGYLVLNTGNKSETSAGYCTLYGDMAGGFSVIKDVPKRLVYLLAGYVNKREGKDIIPKSVFKRAPTAELKPDQKDQDTLPPYDFLDRVIDLYVEKNKEFREIVKKLGHKDIVKKVLSMIDSSEYKRRQAPPGVKITPMAFGKDRRMPITNKFTTC